MKIVKLLRYLLVIGIVSLATTKVIPHFKDLSKLWTLKDNIHYFWVVMAIFSQIFQYVGDGWLSQILLKIVHGKVRLKDSFRIASINVFAAHLLPVGEAGAVAAAYHFYRKIGVSSSDFIFLSICWTIVSNVLLIVFLILSLLFIPNPPIRIDLHFMVIILGTILILLIAYQYRRLIFHKLEASFGKYSWFSHFSTFVRKRHDYKNLVLNNPLQTILAFGAGGIYYISNIATLGFSFLAFGELPHISLITFAYSASLLLGRITLTPGGLGASDAILVLAFNSAGISNEIIIASILLYRLISFWLPIPAGSFSFYSLKKEYGNKDGNNVNEIDIPGL